MEIAPLTVTMAVGEAEVERGVRTWWVSGQRCRHSHLKEAEMRSMGCARAVTAAAVALAVWEAAQVRRVARASLVTESRSSGVRSWACEEAVLAAAQAVEVNIFAGWVVGCASWGIVAAVENSSDMPVCWTAGYGRTHAQMGDSQDVHHLPGRHFDGHTDVDIDEDDELVHHFREQATVSHHDQIEMVYEVEAEDCLATAVAVV